MTKAKVAQHTTIANVIEVHHQKPMGSSLKLSEMFERPHFRVLKAIKRLAERGRLTTPPVVSDWVDSTGRKNELLLLDERSALISAPFIGGAKAEEVQCRIVDAYLYYRQAYADPPRRDLAAEKRAANHPMMEALVECRELRGKDTDARHFMCESKLCNFIISGAFASLDESALSNEDLSLLAQVRRRNESMLHVGFEYAERKKLLTAFAIRERTKLIASAAPTPLLETA